MITKKDGLSAASYPHAARRLDLPSMYPLGPSFGFKALFYATLVKDINHFFFGRFSDHRTIQPTEDYASVTESRVVEFSGRTEFADLPNELHLQGARE